MADIAVIIVNYRTPDLAIRCVESLLSERENLSRLRVVVVDGGSGDDSASQLADFTQAHADWVSFLPLSTNGGFGWANNQAIMTLARSENSPDFIHLLNPDAEVMPGAVSALVRVLKSDARCGAAGSQLINPEGERAASAFRFPSVGREFIAGAQSEKLGTLLGIEATVAADGDREVDWVTGASVMFRADALRDVGLFDDGFFLYFEEVELMHRLKARGWTVRHVPQSRVIHIEGASTGIGAATSQRPHPVYWYQSRRRYFALTRGRAAVVTANLALVAGKVASRLKVLFGRPASVTACRLHDLFARGFLPTSSDALPSVPHWGATPGALPAWMTRK